ncbi:MAG: helix-turn-helix domain-containing protein [Microthrixaceae bacterium]
MDRWTVTVEEAAQMLGISRSSAYECVRRGELRALAAGSAVGGASLGARGAPGRHVRRSSDPES